MEGREDAVLLRDCQAIQIPDGTPVLLPEGSTVHITQALGGSYTVLTDQGYMVRIDEKDADAIGKESPQAPGTEIPEGSTLEELVWEQLRKCYDPEIPVNIVDLGLIYDCEIQDHPDGGKRVEIKMTLTAPGCGMGEILAQDVQRRVEGLPTVTETRVEIVFDPQWNPNMMSEAAKLELGFF